MKSVEKYEEAGLGTSIAKGGSLVAPALLKGHHIFIWAYAIGILIIV